MQKYQMIILRHGENVYNSDQFCVLRISLSCLTADFVNIVGRLQDNERAFEATERSQSGQAMEGNGNKFQYSSRLNVCR